MFFSSEKDSIAMRAIILSRPRHCSTVLPSSVPGEQLTLGEAWMDDSEKENDSTTIAFRAGGRRERSLDCSPRDESSVSPCLEQDELLAGVIRCSCHCQPWPPATTSD